MLDTLPVNVAPAPALIATEGTDTVEIETDVEPVQPPLFTVTAYVPADEMLIVEVVAPVLHKYPEKVGVTLNVRLLPTHNGIVCAKGTEGERPEERVKLPDVVPTQPLASVTVT